MTTRMIKNKSERKKTTKENKKIKKKKINTKLKKLLIFLLIIIMITLIYAFFIEPHLLIVKEHKIVTEKIPDSFHGIKVVQFSDLHYGTTINKKNINKITKKINFLNPDIVVFTGDLIDEKTKPTKKDIKVLTDELNNINSKLGKYAIIGNHDFYNKEYSTILYNANFKLLKNDLDLIYYKDKTPIIIYGIDNYTFGEPNLEKLDDKYNNYYKILLTHEPDYMKLLDKDFDLVLAGHSHNGQAKLPFAKPIWLPKGARYYYDEYYKINNTDLYVSNGIGTSIINIRLNSIPSISLFRITKK